MLWRLMPIVFVLKVFTVQGDVTGLHLKVLQGPVYRVWDDRYSPLTLQVGYNVSDDQVVAKLEEMDSMNTVLAVRAETELEWHLQFLNDTATFSSEEIRNGVNKTILLYGYYWGYFKVYFYGRFAPEDDDVSLNSSSYLTQSPSAGDWILVENGTMVIVDRKPTSKTVDTVLTALVAVFMFINTVNLGCQLDLKIIISVLQKPIGPLCGVISQFMCMPVLSFVTGWLLLDDPLHRLGLFTFGCSPGGNASNLWTLLFNGDLNLSITMTFCSTIIAMGMMPFWMFTLGKKLLDPESKIVIPYTNMVISLIALTIPIGIGLLIKYKKKSWADLSAKIVKPMTLIILSLIIIVVIFSSYKCFALMTWHLVISGFTVALGGYASGALLASLFCLKKKQIIAISIETAFQNAAIAYVILKLLLSTPDSDLAAVVVVAQVLQMSPCLLALYLVWQCLQSCGYCSPGQQTQAIKDKENRGQGMLVLNNRAPDDALRTPGLLFDPSLPPDLRDYTVNV